MIVWTCRCVCKAKCCCMEVRTFMYLCIEGCVGVGVYVCGCRVVCVGVGVGLYVWVLFNVCMSV